MNIMVSIHAPAWGATLYMGFVHELISCFNPRTRVGCDPSQSGRNYKQHGFNPRTRVGCDVRYCLTLPAIIEFQSTHPRGVRLVILGVFITKEFVSIHAPAWGATLQSLFQTLSTIGFNPRTRVGCDRQSLGLLWLPYLCFNPRTRVGCDNCVWR